MIIQDLNTAIIYNLEVFLGSLILVSTTQTPAETSLFIPDENNSTFKITVEDGNILFENLHTPFYSEKVFLYEGEIKYELKIIAGSLSLESVDFELLLFDTIATEESFINSYDTIQLLYIYVAEQSGMAILNAVGE